MNDLIEAICLGRKNNWLLQADNKREKANYIADIIRSKLHLFVFIVVDKQQLSCV